MNRDDVIRMAREAEAWPLIDHDGIAALERFAELVAAAEREACIKALEEFAEWGLKDDMGSKAKDMKAGVHQSVLLLRARNE
jgi:hypothetical protein